MAGTSHLRQVFDKFDVDKSGAVSTEEMTKMCRNLRLELSAAQIRALMNEADPDGSGQIEFGEFQKVLQKQLQAGKGGLAEVVKGGGDAFGWLNPLSWFGAEPPPPSPPPPQKGKASKGATSSVGVLTQTPKGAKGAGTTPKGAGKGGGKGTSATPKRAPKASPKGAGASSASRPGSPGKRGGSGGAGGGSSRRSAAAGSPLPAAVSASATSLEVRSPGDHRRSPPRKKKTQEAVQQANRQQAVRIREEHDQARAFLQTQQDQLHAVGLSRVLKGHQQASELVESLEQMKQRKRLMVRRAYRSPAATPRPGCARLCPAVPGCAGLCRAVPGCAGLCRRLRRKAPRASRAPHARTC